MTTGRKSNYNSINQIIFNKDFTNLRLYRTYLKFHVSS